MRVVGRPGTSLSGADFAKNNSQNLPACAVNHPVGYELKLGEPNNSNTYSQKSSAKSVPFARVWGVFWGRYFTIESKSPISIDSSEPPPDWFLIGTTRESRDGRVNAPVSDVPTQM
jgi:hypothetical protein